ncbi:helix-turn-helix domain-containing protein [Flavobacterium xueshanense]|uniref:AraC-type DNA-binding protein n=1 Tax=Flavobacterium xueshanense TaxID=935223 RepID=A0A1I2BG48_9FLAO|nr:helix-turn-helix domain-containing protein [Flavobacterium xueshanense]SFE55135.1 AraC-type DNA-binding protein [Flavobacterium xueshanense]
MTNQQFLKIVLAVLFPFFLWSQTSKPIQKSDSYEDLKKEFISQKSDYNKKRFILEIISNSYSKKNNLNLSRSFYLLSTLYKGNKAIQYLDSSIAYSTNQNDYNFPALSYSRKAYELRMQFKYSKALDNFFKAEKYANGNNEDLNFYIKRSIGVLRSEELGEVEEALLLYRECLNYIRKKELSSLKYSSDYHNLLFVLADAHKSLKNLDSASFYNKLGYKESIKTNDKFYIPYFILNEGANEMLKKNYKASLDSINKALPQIILDKNYGNILASYFYLGKSYAGMSNENKAIQNFIKVDSMYLLNKRITPEFISGYSYLIEYYKKTGDKENQLKFLNKIMSIDSILHRNYKYLNKVLVKEYDTPHLIAEKEALIQSLEKRQSTSYIWIVVLVVGVTGLFGYQFYLKKQHQKRFEAILHPAMTTEENSTVLQTQPITPDAKENQVQQSLSDEIILELLEKLIVFENDKGFIEKTISIQKLALQLSTNTKYLSKVINEQKGKTFVQYINELRVNEAVLQMQAQPILQNYTIASLASEFGFNSAEAFSAAFYKKYKIKPSFFIKELSKTRAS